MRLFRFLLVATAILLYTLPLRASDSCAVRISLLTCGPGTELYSMWGHTAIRVIDSSRQADIVFNYGTFDDSDPYFYVKFTRGIMRYALSVETYADFLSEYQYEGRSVEEQVLNLTCQAKDSLVRALLLNAREENRYYDYHFHTDNCTTRAGDIILKQLNGKPAFGDILGKGHPSYRDLIHEYLDRGGLAWSKFGIDILLGSRLDQAVNNRQAMFLPDYLMKGFAQCSSGSQPLVRETREILHGKNEKAATGWFTPMLFFSVLLIIVALLSASRSQTLIRLLNIFDSLFFFALGLLGLLLLTLWIIRVDDVCRNNLNLLWALPTHLPVAFLLHRKKGWIRQYFKYVFFISLLLAVGWFFLPQQLNIAIAPLLLIIIVRSYFRSRWSTR